MGGFLYRVGRVSARHRFVVIGVWVVLVVLAVGAVKVYGAKTDNGLTLPGTNSQAAFDLLADQFPPQQNGTNPFVFHVDHGKLTDPAHKAAITASFKAIKSSHDVYSVTNPVTKDAADAGLLSEDGQTGLMPVLLTVGSGFITERLAQKVLDATEPARKAGVQVAVGGSIGGVLSTPDTKQSEILGNLAAMVILALVFTSLVAMGTPILTAVFALSIATSVIGWATSWRSRRWHRRWRR